MPVPMSQPVPTAIDPELPRLIFPYSNPAEISPIPELEPPVAAAVFDSVPALKSDSVDLPV